MNESKRRVFFTRTRVMAGIALGAIVMLGAWLRFDELGRESFWGDEFAYVYLDTQPPGAHHLYSHGFDAYIHVYGKLLHVVGGTLKNEFAMRALPAALGTVAVLLAGILGMQCGSIAVGLIAALVLALHPFAVDTSRTATQYGHQLFGVTLLLVCAVSVVRRMRWWAVAGLVLASVFVAHLQVLFVTIVAATWMMLWGTTVLDVVKGRPGARRRGLILLLAACGVALLCFPEYWFYIRPSLATGGRLDAAASAVPLWQLADWNYIAGTLIAQQPWQRYFLFALMIIGAVWLAWRRAALFTIFTIACVITVVVLYAMRMHSNIGVPPRYISYLFPLFWLCVAAGMWLLARTTGTVAAMAVMALKAFGTAMPDFIRQAWRCKTACAAAFIVAAVILSCFVLHALQLVLHRRHIFGFSDWREAAAFLKTHARSNDVIVTSYHDDILRFYGTNFPCGLVRAYGAYDGRDFTLERLHELQAQYPRIWSILVNKYMRWNSHPAAVEMDGEWIAMPTDDPIIHYWDRTEASSWRDITLKRAKEKELLSAYLRQAPRHYLVRRHLGLLQYWTGDYTASLSNWFMVLRQYPFDPWNWEVPGLCYRDGKGVVQELPRALRFFRVMYWVARFEHHPDRRARIYALRYLADTYRLMKRPKRVLAVVKEWERQLPLSKLTRDQIEHERRTLGALRTDALDRLGLLPVFSNLLHNSDFARPVRIWDGTPSNAIGNWSLLAPWFTNHVNYGRDSDGRYFARVYNDVSNRYTGVMQSVMLQSGSVYRLSGKGRSTSDIMGMRLVAEVRPEGSQRPAESHQVVWWQGSREWQRLGVIFTNHTASPCTVVLQLGYGGTISSSECTAVRLEKLE